MEKLRFGAVKAQVQWLRTAHYPEVAAKGAFYPFSEPQGNPTRVCSGLVETEIKPRLDDRYVPDKKHVKEKHPAARQGGGSPSNQAYMMYSDNRLLCV